jgi:hypothetical protein
VKLFNAINPKPNSATKRQIARTILTRVRDISHASLYISYMMYQPLPRT